MTDPNDDIKDTVVRNRVSAGRYVFYWFDEHGNMQRLSRGIQPHQLRVISDDALEHEVEEVT